MALLSATVNILWFLRLIESARILVILNVFLENYMCCIMFVDGQMLIKRSHLTVYLLLFEYYLIYGKKIWR